MTGPDIPVTRIEEVVAQTSFSENAEDRSSAEHRFLEYYGLNEQPFGVTPDPRFLYLGSKHKQALTALTYGTELNRGFLTLIAKPGMGKTSLLFEYLGGLRNKVRTAFLFQTTGNARDLMYYLLADLGLDGAGKDLPEMHSRLNQVLLDEMRTGGRLVVVIDEAQNLDDEVLESVRLLSNFETPWMKLVQIVLAGQPQLADKLAKPSMVQLRQRVSFSIRIEPLTREEVDTYIDYRLGIAGYKGSSLFSVGARTLIAERSEGIPRNINNMCFCAMSLAWALKAPTIDREITQDVLADLGPGSPNEKPSLPPKSAAEPKPIVPNTYRAPVLTVKDTPALGWLTRVAVAGLVLFALGWLGVYFNVAQRIGSAIHDIPAAIKSDGVRVQTPPFGPSIPDGSHDSLMGTNSEAPAYDKNSNIPLQDKSELPRPGPGSN
ncbi:MAG: AAA family ATPase [Candidatus Acidiferrales bacterium]|jgi:type II secretory pathway predicted ATPase ExeA